MKLLLNYLNLNQKKNEKSGPLNTKDRSTVRTLKVFLKERTVLEEKKAPKKGTGKKPKGSGRRLYTDENPKDTVRIKFATPADARATVAKVKKIKKPFARKIQILTVMEQRAKVMKKDEVVRIAQRAKEALRKARA